MCEVYCCYDLSGEDVRFFYLPGSDSCWEDYCICHCSEYYLVDGVNLCSSDSDLFVGMVNRFVIDITRSTAYADRKCHSG